MAVPVSTHSKTAILSNGFIRKLVKFDHHYHQTQLQPDRLHHKIKINLDFMIEQPVAMVGVVPDSSSSSSAWRGEVHRRRLVLETISETLAAKRLKKRSVAKPQPKERGQSRNAGSARRYRCGRNTRTKLSALLKNPRSTQGFRRIAIQKDFSRAAGLSQLNLPSRLRQQQTIEPLRVRPDGIGS